MRLIKKIDDIKNDTSEKYDSQLRHSFSYS